MTSRRMTRAALALLLTAIAVVAAACGASKDKTNASAQANAVDRAFVAQMIPHHGMAVQMAKTAQQRGGHGQIKTLAAQIITAQDKEITQMRAIAKQLGVKPAGMPTGGMDNGTTGADAKTLGLSMDQMGMSMNMGALNTAKPFDRSFIDDMVPHHQGAIRMAREELAEGTDPQLQQIATGIVAAQTREIGEMNSWRTDWFGKPSPAGGVPRA